MLTPYCLHTLTFYWSELFDRAWLVWTPVGLKITKTIGADNPLTEAGAVPLLTMDVWEHAYYLNYQNLRQSYEETFVDKLINWDFVAAQLPANAA